MQRVPLPRGYTVAAICNFMLIMGTKAIDTAQLSSMVMRKGQQRRIQLIKDEQEVQ